jgi:hypothetical protein
MSQKSVIRMAPGLALEPAPGVCWILADMLAALVEKMAVELPGFWGLGVVQIALLLAGEVAELFVMERPSATLVKVLVLLVEFPA